MRLLFITFFTLIQLGFTACSDSKPKEAEVTAVVPISEGNQAPIRNQKTVPVKVITTGGFHNDEVWENVEKIQWTGLFKGRNEYYLKQTKVHAVHVNDPVLDEAYQKTGWELSTPEKDTNILLISASAGLPEGKVKHVKITGEYIFPGDTLSFHFLGKDYQLFATGKKEKKPELSEEYQFSDYKLYLTTRIDGKQCKTLLSDHKTFEDNMVFLIFAGDLDQDGIVDLILDNSYHYNLTEPTIYLSGKAGKGQVVKRIASQASVGC